MQSLGRKKWLKSNFLHVWSHPFLMMWPSLKTSLTNTFGEEVHGPWGLLCVSWTWGPNPPPSPSYGLYPLPLCAQICCFQSQYDPGSLSRGPSKVKTIFIIIATPFSYVWLLKLSFSQEFSRGYWWVVEYVLLESCVLSFFCFHF